MSRRIAQLSNLYGPLQPDLAQRLAEYAAAPSVERWNGVASLIIRARPMLTVWQAWIAVDDLAPREKAGGEWSRIPDAFTFRRALRYATEQVSR